MPMNQIAQQEPGLPSERPLHVRMPGIVLAGGKGTRLLPLTRERAKLAVPFGGKYWIIDFVLSNFINSGINSIYVLTQFRSQSLLQHLSEGWQFSGLLKSYFIIPVPAHMPGVNLGEHLNDGDGRVLLEYHCLPLLAWQIRVQVEDLFGMPEGQFLR